MLHIFVDIFLILRKSEERLRREEIGRWSKLRNFSVEILESPRRNGKILRNFEIFLPNFHFILPKFYFPVPWRIFIFPLTSPNFLGRKLEKQESLRES